MVFENNKQTQQPLTRMYFIHVQSIIIRCSSHNKNINTAYRINYSRAHWRLLNLYEWFRSVSNDVLVHIGRWFLKKCRMRMDPTKMCACDGGSYLNFCNLFWLGIFVRSIVVFSTWNSDAFQTSETEIFVQTLYIPRVNELVACSVCLKKCRAPDE